MESLNALPRKIKLQRLAHVYYKHVNLERQHEFLLDFGFSEVKRVGKKIYYRGYGTEPFVYCAEQAGEDRFGGTAFAVQSLEDLELASKFLPGASEIYQMEDSPGGGSCVTFLDPVDKFPFHLVYGQTLVELSALLPELDYNYPTQKNRSVGQYQRFEKGPAPVHKMGHFGMCITDFAKSYEFYTTHFNLVASDLLHDGTGRSVTSFMHLDLGEEYVDHHCFFIFEGPKSHVHHSSFEVHDFDVQIIGHDWLREKNWENCWGIGRHVMGSQIFDYWFDPSRFILEHYVDGDLVNNTIPTHYGLASKDDLHVWGPDLPPDFMQ